MGVRINTVIVSTGIVLGAAGLYLFLGHESTNTEAATAPTITPVSKSEILTYSFEACNKSAEQISLAYAYFEKPSDDYVTIRGWRNIKKDECSNLFTLDFGNNDSSYFYYFAENANGGAWSGDNSLKLCIPNQKFVRKNSGGYQCKSDELLRSFGKQTVTRDQPIYSLDIVD